ncbi:hypothetical protein HYPSUDRAFT_1096055, partial [Hypholoma sublateritium FD-334 SS-4]
VGHVAVHAEEFPLGRIDNVFELLQCDDSSLSREENVHRIQGTPRIGPDFGGIVLLLFTNSFIGFYEESDAGNVVKAIMDSLGPKAKVKRAGSWSEIKSPRRHNLLQGW